MRKEQLQQIVQLIQAMPCWEQTAQLRAMTCALRYGGSDSERMAQIQRMRASVERLMRNDPLTRLHEALTEAERTLEHATLRSGDPV